MEAGSWAEWVAALFTGGGLIFAAYQIRQARTEAQVARQRDYDLEEQRREAMAQAVGVTASWQPGPDGGPPSGHDGLMPVRTQVLNAGPFPISGAVLVLDCDNYPMEIVYGTILPGQHIEDTHKARRSEVVFAKMSGGATLLFTDVHGTHWARTPYVLSGAISQH